MNTAAEASALDGQKKEFHHGATEHTEKNRRTKFMLNLGVLGCYVVK
jgi:hypothetical protein